MKNQTQICNFCHSEEGKPRPIGNYIVELKELDVLGTNKLACQSCYRKTKKSLKSPKRHTIMMKESLIKKIRKFGDKLFS